jgi:hypothetical protein
MIVNKFSRPTYTASLWKDLRHKFSLYCIFMNIYALKLSVLVYFI